MANGEIVHIEFPAKDMERVSRFWNGLFGWQFGASVMPDFDYRMAQTSETAGAAIMPADETGHANYYFDTDDIESSIAKVRELGGEAADKMPVPTHGWFSACKDSEGNAFYLWQSDSNAG
jgi:predicted enzyme related to lactoylglutathione lyase